MRVARREGEIKGKAEALIVALKERFGTLAADLLSQIQASTDSEQIDRWMRLAVSLSVTNLEQFRHGPESGNKKASRERQRPENASH